MEEKDVNLQPADVAKYVDINAEYFENVYLAECRSNARPFRRLPAHWLANGKGQHESVKSALWTLRNLMLKDALAIKNHFA